MLQALLIVIMQFVIVPLTTLRTIFVVKGEIRTASILGGLEALIYVISLGIIFSDLSNYLNMIAYAVGYAGGVVLGGYVERKLAIGYRTYNVSLLEKDLELCEMLRAEGFGVTLFEGEGRDGNKRFRLDIVVKRNREKELMKILDEKAPRAFIVAYEPTSFKGGYLVKSMKKAVKLRTFPITKQKP
ncbi:DUF2179 domain-containing protein [Niallia sp. XMNu-256]|uniref:DUF2179 domain-containing protein n=1 Tax=Niallia sp. XMNu-256 TaxID=3082444 RepID=UPI0030CB9EDC